MSLKKYLKDFEGVIYYQIFPDRFAGYRGVYEKIPDAKKFYGGSLRGIKEKIPYLKWLGVECIYLNPIFHAHSPHRYNTYNYYEIDPLLGSENDFIELSGELKKAGIRLILDGVFNHSGDDHPFFRLALKNKNYRNYYFIKKLPLPENLTKENVQEYYECWWNYPKLPKMNVLYKPLKKHLFGAIKKWNKFIHGWRLDVPNEVPVEFWKEFNKLNKEKITIAEIWHDGYTWLNIFDTFMNYDLRRKILELIESKNYISFAAFLEDFYRKIGDRMHILFNLLSSHDVERFLTTAGSVDLFLKCYFLLFMLPGSVSIYYGDEVGVEGGKDPDNRRVFPWDRKLWNMRILNTMRKLIRIKKLDDFRIGEFKIINADKNGISFLRNKARIDFSFDCCKLNYKNKIYRF